MGVNALILCFAGLGTLGVLSDNRPETRLRLLQGNWEVIFSGEAFASLLRKCLKELSGSIAT
jgi:hypothetical protein